MDPVPDIDVPQCAACMEAINGVATVPCCGKVCEPCILMCFENTAFKTGTVTLTFMCPVCRTALSDEYVSDLVAPELFVMYAVHRSHSNGPPLPLRDTRMHVCPECGDDITDAAREQVLIAARSVPAAVAEGTREEQEYDDDLYTEASNELGENGGDVWAAIQTLVERREKGAMGRRRRPVAAVAVTCDGCFTDSCFACGWPWDDHSGLTCAEFLQKCRAGGGALVPGSTGKNIEFYFPMGVVEVDDETDHFAKLRQVDVHAAKFEDDWWELTNSRRCPVCAAAIEKNGGCCHMTCYMCDADYCWECHAIHGGVVGETCIHGVAYTT